MTNHSVSNKNTLSWDCRVVFASVAKDNKNKMFGIFGKNLIHATVSFYCYQNNNL